MVIMLKVLLKRQFEPSLQVGPLGRRLRRITPRPYLFLVVDQHPRRDLVIVRVTASSGGIGPVLDEIDRANRAMIGMLNASPRDARISKDGLARAFPSQRSEAKRNGGCGHT